MTRAALPALLAVVLAMGALATAAPATAAPQAAVVALGDSAASGEGAGDYAPGTRGERGDWCHRSPHAYIYWQRRVTVDPRALAYGGLDAVGFHLAEESFHPTAAAHAVIGACLAAFVRSDDAIGACVPGPPEPWRCATAGADLSRARPGCGGGG